MGENDVREKQLDFQYLGPKDNVESMEAYEKALDYAFSNPKVRNIAVTGSYGAGKSSIIETYKKSKCCGSRFLHISLTNFEDKETDAKEKETELESQIINQLAHKISSENLKDSHIAMRKRPEWYVVFGWSIFIMALLCCSFYLMNYVSLTELETTDRVLSSIIEKLTARNVFKTALIIEIFCVFFSIYYIVNAQIKHHFFRKICIPLN